VENILNKALPVQVLLMRHCVTFSKCVKHVNS